MDVICEQCGAEYEFDETLLSDKGTTVKCSACGHVFRVMPTNRELGRAQLMLRPARGGRDVPLASLRDLQQRIGGGEVSLDDQIGREGHPFRPLHEIPELKNFFGRAADESGGQPAAKAPDGPPTVRRPTGTLMGSVPNESFDQKLTPTVPAPPGSTPEAIASLPPPPATPKFGPEVTARAPAKRTIMGVGPAGAGPSAAVPRDPASGQATLGPAAAMLRPDSPGPGKPKPSEPTPPPREPRAAPRAGGGSVTPTLLGAPGSAPVPPAAQPPPASAHRPPVSPSSSDRPSPGQAPAPQGLRIPPGGLPGFQLPGSSVPPPAGSVRPAAMGSFSPPAPVGAERSSPPVAVGPAGRVQLYLSDDERPPTSTIRRASSKLWLVALILIALGGAGWFGVHTLAGPGQGATPPSASVAPDPSTTAPSPAAATPTPAEPKPEEAPAQAPAAAEPAQAEAPSTPAPGEAGTATTTTPPPVPATTDKAAPEKTKAKTEPAKPERVAEAEDYGQLVSRAAQLAKRGDQAGAIKLYRAALGLRPSAAEANTGLGFALLATGKAAEALPLFDRAVSDGFVDANIGLGDAYRKLNQPSSALEAYRAYLERMPSGGRANYARQAIAKLEGGGPAATPPSGAGDSYRPAGELEAPPSAPAPAPTPPAAEPAAPPSTPSGPDPLPERPVAPSEPSP